MDQDKHTTEKIKLEIELSPAVQNGLETYAKELNTSVSKVVEYLYFFHAKSSAK